MKTKLAILCSLSLLPFTTGCKTTPTFTATPESLQAKANAIAFAVTAESLRQHPEWTEHFKIAAFEFETLAASTNVTVATITAIVAQLPTQKLQGERAAILISAGTLLLKDEISQIAIEQPAELRSVAKGIQQGIELGLAWQK